MLKAVYIQNDLLKRLLYIAVFIVFSLGIVFWSLVMHRLQPLLHSPLPPPTPDNEYIISKFDGNTSVVLEMYNFRTNLTNDDQSLAEELSQPFLYKFNGLPHDFKLWLFKEGDNWVSKSIRIGGIWEL